MRKRLKKAKKRVNRWVSFETQEDQTPPSCLCLHPTDTALVVKVEVTVVVKAVKVAAVAKK
jgi:hypothetical protein